MSRIVNTREVILTSDNSSEHWNAAVWDPQTGSILSTYKSAGTLSHRTLQVLSDSYIIGADLTKPRIHVWPLNSSSPVSNLRLTTPGKVTALCCTPSGSYIVAAVSEKLFLWQVCNGRLLKNLSQHYQTVNCLSFSKDGSLFASGAEDGLIFVWSLYGVLNDEHPKALRFFSHHSMPVKDLQFGHAGVRARLYSVSLDRTCNVYDPTSGLLLLVLVFDVPLTCVSINIRESDLFVGCTDGNIYRFILHEAPRGIEHHVQKDGNSKDVLIFQGHKSIVVSLSISINCLYLLSGSISGEVHVWDINSRQILRTLEHKGAITAAFFAKYYENFRVADLKPRLQLCNLQRISDDAGKESVIEVLSQNQSAADILNFDSYTESNIDTTEPGNLTSQKLLEMREEIDKLKKINTAIYQYSVNHILNKSHKDLTSS
ncbi:WD repeat-containing protein 18 [Eufriesea mexicana]|uniref:WD repeat-containing protein 18 n=1 Tax=Eufriesea mexicana TaxID=516756 RepID=A0A310SG52_9HYME|nr:PREDICTED: WD repeat-containing protein 18 [Eufriesea mexicana]OAD53219.1 WD repeat-containing protein 18 [Eufriesea mexicana]